MARRSHVYRLEVTWPEDDPGVQYEWATPHLYLSRSGADARARKMRADGIKVTVVRSLPVQWPGDDP